MKRVDDIAKSNLSLPAKWLAVFMAHHENRKGEVTATLSEIRAWTSLSTRTIQYGLEDLQQAGFISVITPFQRTANSSAKFALTLRDASGASPVSAVVTQEMRQIVSENAINDAETVDSLASARRSSPPLILSESMSSPEVQENEELGQEGISITRDAQGELISIEPPTWLTDLRTTPGYNLDAAHERRLIERIEVSAISTQRLCETAASIAAKWESIKWSPTHKQGYKRIDLTFIAWAKREGFNGGKPNNGRYRAPGTDIPKAGTPEAHARWPAQTYDA